MPTAPAPKLTVKVLISSRFVAATATPWKPDWLSRLAVRAKAPVIGLLVPSPFRSMPPRFGVFTCPADLNESRLPLVAPVMVVPLLVSMPWPLELLGSNDVKPASVPVLIRPVLTARPEP